MSHRLVFLILFFVGFITYFPTLNNDFIIGDDEDQIVNHSLIHDPKNIPQLFSGSTYFVESANTAWGLFYRPLMLTVYSLIYAVFGSDPLFFHLFSLLLHILNAYLVFLLFHQLIAATYPKTARSGTARLLPGESRTDFWVGAAIALIFLIHPINSEAVLHAANLQELLVTFFGLLLLLRVLKPIQNLWLFTVHCSLLTALCLLSKETGLLFIVLALALSLFINRKPFLVHLLLLFSATLSFVTYFILRTNAGVGFSPPQFGLMHQLTLTQRLLQLPSVLFYYLKTFFFPLNLAAYQDWLISTPTLQNFYLPLISLTLFALGIWILFLNRKSKILNLFIIWFLLFLLPLSHLYPLYTTVAERWFYPGSIGLLGIIGVILTFRRFPYWLIASGYLLISLLAFRTHLRAYNWHDSQTLLEHDLPLSESPFYAQNLLATLYLRQDRYLDALPLVERSIHRFPNTGNLTNRGVIAVNQKDYPAAKTYYQQALSHGRIYGAVLNYMNLLVFIDPDYPLSQTFIEENLKVYPQSPELWLGLAVARYYQKDPDSARKFAQKSFSLAPLPITQELLSAIDQTRPPDFTSFLKP